MLKILGAAALVFALSTGLVEAQDVTNIVTVNRRTILGAQQFTAVSPITQAMAPNGNEYLRVSVDISRADKKDPAKSFRFRLLCSNDNGTHWTQVLWAERLAGDPTLTNAEADATQIYVEAPVQTPAYTLIGALCRIELDVSTQMSIGGSIDVLVPVF